MTTRPHTFSRLAFALTTTMIVGLGLASVTSPGGCGTGRDDDFQIRLVKSTGVTTECGPGEWNDTTEPSGGGMFVDITSQSGLDFHRAVGPPGTYFLPEINGSGGAMFDYDGDGDLDIYLVNSGRSPHAVGDFSASVNTANCLYRQQADGTFSDVTATAGLGDTGYGVGCAAGDVDNDGDLDIVVTNYGPDRLFLNDGQGHFKDVTRTAGLTSSGWGCSAAFCDYDRDGRLDLFITQYGEKDPLTHDHTCNYGNGQPGYCSSAYYAPSTDRLFHNDGPGPDGVVRFRDVTTAAELHWHNGKGTGYCVIPADLNADGWPDFYVANDMYPNRLWINQKDGTFRDVGPKTGAAFNRHGLHEASMGLAIGDVDSDGDPDLLATHMTDETNTLYINDSGQFHDLTHKWKLADTSRRHTGWGVALIDLDHDGFLDIPLVNGLVIPCKQRHDINEHNPPTGVITIDQLTRTGKTLIASPKTHWARYHDRNQLYFNTGKSSFVERTDQGGDFSRTPASGRALIHGDIDNDGDVDLLVTDLNGRARLFRNDVRKIGHWLLLRVTDPRHQRDAYGAEVVIVEGERRHHRIVNSAGSYLASHDPRVHVGLKAKQFDHIQVRWPDGPQNWETFDGGDTDRRLSLVRGEGTTAKAPPPVPSQPNTQPDAPPGVSGVNR